MRGLLQVLILARRARTALRDRRGASAVAVAVAGSALVGMAGLATEGTLLLLTRRDAQHAADIAAMAAASAHQFRGRAAALAAAEEMGGRNGFAVPAVSVSNPPVSGAQRGNASAFEVRILSRVPIVLGRAMLGRDHGTVEARAVSVLQGTTPACLLALRGTLTVQNSSLFEAVNCGIGSNGPGVSINIPQSNSAVRAVAAVAAGSCSGCNNTRWSFAQGYQENAAPLSNPYERLDSKPVPTPCVRPGRGPNNTVTIEPTGTARAYCEEVTLGNQSSVSLRSGTYVFRNAPFNVSGTSSFTCNGCTFIFTGTDPRTISLGNVSTVNITAPSANNDDPDYDGVLIHRARGGAPGNAGNPGIRFQNASSFNVVGGIYAPDSHVALGQVSSNTTTTCLALVAGSVEISGLSSFRFNASGCATARTPLPVARVARLVE